MSHGQADVERGFSLNKAIISDRTALSERALCGLRTVKDVIEQYSSIVEIPITRGILSAQRNAYQKYKAALDATKTAAANEERQAKREREIDNRVKELNEKKLKLETSRLQAEMMINEGSDRLTASIKSGKLVTLEEGRVAQGVATHHLEVFDAVQKQVHPCDGRGSQVLLLPVHLAP